MTIDLAAMRFEIETYVLEERARLGIGAVDGTVKSEPSGEAFDEFESLLDRQLVTTSIGLGGWTSLSDETTLRRVHAVVKSRLSQRS